MRNKNSNPPEVSVVEVKRQLGLPHSAQFLGYVVHQPDLDEFLYEVINLPDACYRSWASMPDLAKIYTTYNAARHDADAYGKGALVALLFEAGNKYCVSYCG